MKKNSLLICIVLVLGLVSFFVLSAASNEVKEQNAKKESHPKLLSPEETLKTFFDAFIARDIETVMAYLPFENIEKYAEQRNRKKAFFQVYMTEEYHIQSIESIKLKKTETNGPDVLAFIEATLVTPFELNSLSKQVESGKYKTTLDWCFRQYKKTGPWFFDGGGF